MLNRAAARVAFVAASVAVVGAALRLIEWPKWSGANAWLDSEPIPATADAYAWMAGALGTGRLADWPLSSLIAGLASAAGQSPAWVAFWLPVALAPLSGSLVAVICARRGWYLAALGGGVLAGSSLGYLGRTRLGYTDTDLFALTLAVALAGACAVAARSLVAAVREDALTAGAGCRLALAPFVLWAGMALYPSGYPVALAILATTAVYVLTATRGRHAGLLIAWFAAALLAAHFGLAGLAAGLAVCLGLVRHPSLLRPLVAVALLGATLLGIAVFQQDALGEHLRRVSAYLGGFTASAPSGWQLPWVADSIQETTALGLAGYIQRVASHWIFLLAGLAGYGLVVRRKPEYLAFLPLLVLGLAGYALGPRFAMYAAPVLGLGLGLGLPLAAETLGLRRWAGLGLQGFLLIAVVGVLAWRALEPEPDPVLEPGHARALRDLAEYPANQGRVWAWWDRGYAAQYYAGLPTFADGGNASRARIFALGQAFGAADPLEAAQVMKLGAMARAARASDTEDWRAAAYRSHPMELLADMPANLAQQEINALAERKRSWPDALPDAFLVVNWSTLRQAQWVNHFSRWTLTAGAGGHGQISSLKPPVRLDEDEGVLHTPDGPVPLASIDILDQASHYRNRWPRADGAHAVINNSNGEGVLMDGTLYRMMAVQMLIGETERFERHFELVTDRFPAARVYRVR